MTKARITPLIIIDHTLTTALGCGRQINLASLKQSKTGLTPCSFQAISDLSTWTGEVDGVDDVVLNETLKKYDCRNNRLAQLGLQQDEFIKSVEKASAKYGPSRVGVFIGTSTSGIQQTEMAYEQALKEHDETKVLPDWFHYPETQNVYSCSDFVQRYLALSGVSYSISTACSSSAKVFAAAHRAIAAGFCDAAVVGGVDTLCLTTLYGFNSLQVTSAEICRPSDAQRGGISIGEAAGFALVEMQNESNGGVAILGYGESSDAYHMSSPHPEGRGAFMAMSEAVERANLQPADIDYVNLHGTATPANDTAEGKAVSRLFGNTLPCSSTKGWTGHTLGAAGIVEVIFSAFSIQENWLPQSLNTRDVDTGIEANILLQPQTHLPINYVVSNSFGFGGSNCSLVIGEVKATANKQGKEEGVKQ